MVASEAPEAVEAVQATRLRTQPHRLRVSSHITGTKKTIETINHFVADPPHDHDSQCDSKKLKKCGMSP